MIYHTIEKVDFLTDQSKMIDDQVLFGITQSRPSRTYIFFFSKVKENLSTELEGLWYIK